MTRSAVDRLTEYLFDGPAEHAHAGELTAEVAAWLGSSARFRAFVERHRDKIRKKLRGSTDADARRDVRAELRAAHLLLGDRRLELAFEAYGSAKGGPDFTVAYRTTSRFNLEVTRPRRPQDLAGVGSTILAKLRQLPPGMSNVLLVAIDGGDATAVDVGAAVRALRARADTKDEDFFAVRGYTGTRGFYERLLRLGAVVAWSDVAAGDARASAWTNGSARISVPDPALRAVLACLRAG
jgi:hypothetical protein